MVLSLPNRLLKIKQERKTCTFRIQYHLQNVIEDPTCINALELLLSKKELLNVLTDLEVVCARNRDVEIRTARAWLCKALASTSLLQDPKNVLNFTQIFGCQWNDLNFGCGKKKERK